ncbi:hypothetical protein BKA80DRAFT_67991 [Phyllosticta citrichinensis]
MSGRGSVGGGRGCDWRGRSALRGEKCLANNATTYLGRRWRRIGAVGLVGRGLRRVRPVRLVRVRVRVRVVWRDGLVERLLVMVRRRLLLRKTLGGLVLRVHLLGRGGWRRRRKPPGMELSAFLSSACHGLGNERRVMVTQGRGGPQGRAGQDRTGQGGQSRAGQDRTRPGSGAEGRAVGAVPKPRISCNGGEGGGGGGEKKDEEERGFGVLML